MKNFLLEGHRPGVSWEKQTRISSAETMGQAVLGAEKVGIILISAQEVGFNISTISRDNPFLCEPWFIGETPVK